MRHASPVAITQATTSQAEPRFHTDDSRPPKTYLELGQKQLTNSNVQWSLK
jgi:hypothetical protein